jgi:hypothetical protein
VKRVTKKYQCPGPDQGSAAVSEAGGAALVKSRPNGRQLRQGELCSVVSISRYFSISRY